MTICSVIRTVLKINWPEYIPLYVRKNFMVPISVSECWTPWDNNITGIRKPELIITCIVLFMTIRKAKKWSTASGTTCIMRSPTSIFCYRASKTTWEFLQPMKKKSTKGKLMHYVLFCISICSVCLAKVMWAGPVKKRFLMSAKFRKK